MSFKIKYRDDGYYLTDDALLYDNPIMREYYGDLIPEVRDCGIYCVFKTVEDENAPVEILDDAVRDQVDGTDRTSAQAIAEALRGAAGTLSQRSAGNLCFPNPRTCGELYRVLSGNRIVILYGLERYERQDGVDSMTVAKWFLGLRAELIQKITELDKAAAFKKEQERKKIEEEEAKRKKKRKKIIWVCAIVGGVLLMTIVALCLMLK